MIAAPENPTFVSGTDDPASADEIEKMSNRPDEAQEANEALSEIETDAPEPDPTPGLRQSDIRGSSD